MQPHDTTPFDYFLDVENFQVKDWNRFRKALKSRNLLVEVDTDDPVASSLTLRGLHGQAHASHHLAFLDLLQQHALPEQDLVITETIEYPHGPVVEVRSWVMLTGIPTVMTVFYTEEGEGLRTRYLNHPHWENGEVVSQKAVFEYLSDRSLQRQLTKGPAWRPVTLSDQTDPTPLTDRNIGGVRDFKKE